MCDTQTTKRAQSFTDRVLFAVDDYCLMVIFLVDNPRDSPSVAG